MCALEASLRRGRKEWNLIWYEEETASVPEQNITNKIIEGLEKNPKYVLNVMTNFLTDAGYDAGSRNALLKDKYNINQLVDNRYMCSKDEKNKRNRKTTVCI